MRSLILAKCEKKFNVIICDFDDKISLGFLLLRIEIIILKYALYYLTRCYDCVDYYQFFVFLFFFFIIGVCEQIHICT